MMILHCIDILEIWMYAVNFILVLKKYKIKQQLRTIINCWKRLRRVSLLGFSDVGVEERGRAGGHLCRRARGLSGRRRRGGRGDGVRASRAAAAGGGLRRPAARGQQQEGEGQAAAWGEASARLDVAGQALPAKKSFRHYRRLIRSSWSDREGAIRDCTLLRSFVCSRVRSLLPVAQRNDLLIDGFFPSSVRQSPPLNCGFLFLHL